jgi:ABC-type nitrate/sulfonate/bicarbonate transport system substrate-binding protein
MTATSKPIARTAGAVSVPSIWYTRCPVPTASSVAITGGWLDREFAADQIAVRSLAESPEPAIRHAHYTHAHPALFREGGAVPPLWASSTTGANVLIGLARIDQFRGLLALRGSRLAESGDLRGAKIALPARPGSQIDFSRAVSLHGIETALASAGCEGGDVTLVDVRWEEDFISHAPRGSGASLYTARENVRLYTAEVLALVRGEVDAIYATGPHALAAAALIDAVPLTGPATNGNRPRGSPGRLQILTVSTQLVRTRRDLVARYVCGLFRAADWAASHASAAWRVIAAEVGVAEEWAHAGYAPQTVADLHPQIADDLLDTLQNRSDFLHRRGFIPRPVDVRRWLDPSPLHTALILHGEQGGQTRREQL